MTTARHPLAPHTLSSHVAPVDVLLGHAFFMALDPKQAAKARPFPPLSTLQLAALLEREGLKVAVFDSMLAAGSADFVTALVAARPRLVILQEDNFNFLSKMCLSRMRQEALAMVRQAAAAGLPVLVSGSDASDHPVPYLDAGALAVARGESEWTLLQATQVLLANGDGRTATTHAPGAPLACIAGLTLPAEGGRLDTPARAIERDPDRFPDPDRSLVDLGAYRSVWQAAHGHACLNLASSRGCPYHCNWCAKPIWGQRYSLRSVERVVAEVAALMEGPNAPDRLWFADDIFGLQPAWTEAFGRAMAGRGLCIPFQIQTRADLMTEGAVRALALAGCAEVWLGAESGDQGILDAMEKGITVDQVRVAVRRLRSAGIAVGLFLQFGYPGEDWPALLRTVDLVRELLPDAIGISVSYPLPGTRFHDRVREELGDRQHWLDSRDLAMLYRGPFSSPVYRRVHRLLHRELDLRLALDRSAEAGERRRLRRGLARLGAAWSRLEALARESEGQGVGHDPGSRARQAATSPAAAGPGDRLPAATHAG